MMRAREKPTIERLRELVSYDPETGSVIWRMTRGGTARKGSVAGHINYHGYLSINFNNYHVLAHMVAWALHYGEWPSMHIDHINCVKTDNRICNLRLATIQENARNRDKSKCNTSGFKGVSFFKGNGKYAANIGINRKKVFLGYFDEPEQAAAAYNAAVQAHHGNFARKSI